jgi:hypothetical protein
MKTTVLLDAKYCCTSQYQCEHLLVPTSNSFALDRCLCFSEFIDRDDRQRPERLSECISQTRAETKCDRFEYEPGTCE